MNNKIRARTRRSSNRDSGDKAFLEPVTRRKSRDETRSRRQVTRRDETRDGLVLSVSRPKVTRRDEIRDQYTNTFWKNSKTSFFAFLRGLFWAETKNVFRDRLARQTHETRRDRDGLVSSRLDIFRDETVSLPALIYSERKGFFIRYPTNIRERSEEGEENDDKDDHDHDLPSPDLPRRSSGGGEGDSKGEEEDYHGVYMKMKKKYEGSGRM